MSYSLDYDNTDPRVSDVQRPRASLMTYLKSNLPNFMVPSRIEWLDELPLNPNGKFDRPLLPSLYCEVLKDAPG